MFNCPVQTAPFKEHPIVDITNAKPHEFDVTTIIENMPGNFIVSGEFSLQQYCNCLLTKLFSLSKTDIKPFILYQCNSLKSPLIWLNILEILMNVNGDLFISNEQNFKAGKILMAIELLPQEIEQNRFRHSNQFDFNKIKMQLKLFHTHEEQLSFLYEAKAEYLQNKPRIIDTYEIPFEEKIAIEVEKIKQLEELKKQNPPTTTSQNDKVRIRGKLNVIVGDFFKLLFEIKVNGLPYLDSSPTEIAKILENNFVDKDGFTLSRKTILTFLSPNKPEKRPKNNNQVNS